MDVRLTPEQEARLAEFAARDGRSPEDLVQEAISRYFEDDAQFIEAVKEGLASLDRGDYVTHEEVSRRIERLFQS